MIVDLMIMGCYIIKKAKVIANTWLLNFKTNESN